MPDVIRMVAQCQQGDLRAFAALFDHFQNQLFDLAYTILGEREAAKDAVQDTFLTVFQKIDSFRGDSAFETWLIAILVNRCRQTLRRRKLRRTLSLENLTARWLPSLAAPANDPALLVAQRQQRQTLWEMVSQLDERLRLPILLRYRYGLSCSEIAAALGLSVNTIYEQLSQGRQRLRQMRREREALPLAVAAENGE